MSTATSLSTYSGGFEFRVFRKRETLVRVTETQTEPEGNDDEVFAFVSMWLFLLETMILFMIFPMWKLFRGPLEVLVRIRV